jgi:hypothetical protein
MCRWAGIGGGSKQASKHTQLERLNYATFCFIMYKFCHLRGFKIPSILIKFSRASSRVKWLKVDKTDVSRTISVLVLRETEVAVKASNLIP